MAIGVEDIDSTIQSEERSKEYSKKQQQHMTNPSVTAQQPPHVKNAWQQHIAREQ